MGRRLWLAQPQQEIDSRVNKWVGSTAMTVGVCSEEDNITDEDA
jgi:hypothetical protein